MKIKFIDKEYEINNDRKIVFSEKGKKYETLNSTQQKILKIHVDGDLICYGQRCDYAIDVLNDKKLYLIELKGADKSHAYEQILASIEFMKKKRCKFAIFTKNYSF